MPKKKFENEEIEAAILTLMQKTPKCVTTEYVAQNVKVSWTTARAMLLSLSLRGKVFCIETTRGMVFELKKAQLEVQQN